MKLSNALMLSLIAAVACAPKPKPKAKAVVTEATAETARRACTYGAGAMASATLATAAPKGKDIPIDHIVMVMQENHSFDSMFSKLQGVTAAADGVTNLDPNGMPVVRAHQDHLCTNDKGHSWADSHTEFDNGKNDGFAKANSSDPARGMGYWDETDLPFYYALARAFTISDSHHCSLLGPTTPNRLFSLAGTSYGETYNTVAPAEDPNMKAYPNVFTELDDAKIDWKYYVDSSPPEGAALIGTYFNDGSHYHLVSDFLADAAAGTLPPFSIVEPKTTNYGDNQDEHPPGDIQIGQQFVASVVKALTTSPNWSKSALFFSYDEHGGFYDSVPPGPACPPDQIPIKYNSPSDPPGAFDTYGFRVPLIVVSPYAKRGYVTHHVTDHTSVLRFIEARFDLPAMTGRDANADPLYDAFDFTHADTSVPTLPDATPEPTQLNYCETTYHP